MIYTRISSLDLYLHFPVEEVLETQCLEDVGCGVYPCYYMKCGDVLKVSTSVTSLIFDSKAFNLNPNFNPPDFLKPEYISKNGKSWYETRDTIDKKIRKLRPFEKVTIEKTMFFSFYKKSNTFKPDFTIRDKDYIVDKTVYFLQNFIHDIEKKFPQHSHIIFTGGKDSQIICLVPKLNKEKWHIFSAEPNFPLVREWLKENNIHVNTLFTHNNINEESVEDFKKKVICGDLYTDPRHNKWLPTVKKIAEKFNYKCIFWSGTQTMPPAHFYIGGRHGRNFKRHPLKFFNDHFNMTSPWQGNTHQIFKNFIGCLLISPYHSREIWEELYQHYNPSAVKEGMDLRFEIGERLFGKPVKWVKENPAPEPYKYSFYFDPYKIYIEYIKENIAKIV